jgi:tetratricopeptide (TPR) repeat protein
MKKLIRIALFLLFIATASILMAQASSDADIDSLHKILKTAIEDSSKADALIVLGDKYYNKGDYEQAITSYRNSFILAKNIGFKRGEADGSGKIGRVLAIQGDYPEAIKYSFTSIRIAEQIGDKGIMFSSYNRIGNIKSWQGNYSEALKYYFLSLALSEETANKTSIASSYANIGISYESIGDLSSAMEYELKALKLYLELDDKMGLNRVYNNIGIIYSDKKSYTEAKANYFAALNVSKEIGDLQGEILALGNIGRALRQEGNYPEALNYYLKVLDISEKMQNKFNFSLSNINIADLYNLIAKSVPTSKDSQDISIENYNKAIVYANKGLEVAQEISAKELIRIANVNLSDSYRGLGDYKKALEYADKSRALKDSILNSETTRKFEQLRTNYEVDKAVIEEKAKSSKREDSLKYQQRLTQASLDLSNERRDLNQLAFFRSQAELEAEQSQRKGKEQQLTILEKEKTLQNNKLALQQTQLELKETQIKQERKQHIFYLVITGLMLITSILIFKYFRDRQISEKQIAEERLKYEKASTASWMTELELQSLRAQLNPHFMFNSLNAIQELILKEDNENSHLYLSRFSELLRMLLDNANQAFVSLNKELNLLELYLSLEKLRIPDLEFAIELGPEIDSNEINMPNMILQPYIENAIWHGLSHKRGSKILSVRINKHANGISCVITDNGVGRKAANELKSAYRKVHRSRGMELLSKRFNLLSKEYGSDIHTAIEDLYNNETAAGTQVSITISNLLTKQLSTVSV